MSLISFYTPLKYETRGFLMFPRGVERDDWYLEMDHLFKRQLQNMVTRTETIR